MLSSLHLLYASLGAFQDIHPQNKTRQPFLVSKSVQNTKVGRILP